MMEAIRLEHVTIHVNDFSIEHLNFAIQKGLVTALIGKNSSGKTTILKAIVHQVPLAAGEIKIFGHSSTSERWKDCIGVMWDDVHWPLQFNAKMIDEINADIYPNWDSIFFKQMCEQLSVEWKQKLKHMSRGTRMKLQFCATLAHRPTLLILDEPTGGLDPFARDEILSTLAEYVDTYHATIFISSHIISDIEKLADELIFLNDGKIAIQIGKDELVDTYGFWRGTVEEFNALDPASVFAWSTNSFGINALLSKKHAPLVPFQQATLEDYLLVIQEYQEKELVT